MHDVVVVGLPMIAILFGILFARSEVKELRADMQARFNKIDERLNRIDQRFDKIEDHLGRIDSDLRQFYHLTGKLEARMDGLEKRN